MKKNIVLFLLLFYVSVAFGQTKEDRNGNLIGHIEKSDFYQGKHKVWFSKNYDKYQPNKKQVKKIKKKLKDISIVCFAGTWCHDSKRELPKFFKLMELAEFDLEKNFKLIGITRGKKTPNNLEEGYNIKHTPTFIFYKNGKEIARYIERSRKSIEEDIYSIISGKNYKHSYQY